LDGEVDGGQGGLVLEFGERLDLVLWETCHIYATCQAYRAEADFQHSPISEKPRMLPYQELLIWWSTSSRSTPLERVPS